MRKYFVKIKEYVSFYAKVMGDLFKSDKTGSVMILVMSLLLPLASVVELKFSEYLVNSVSSQNLSDDKVFKNIILIVLLVMSSLLLFIIGRWIFGMLNNRFTRKVVMQKNSRLLNKISKISYEYFESAKSNQKIWLSCQAPGQYAQSISYISSLFNVLMYFIVYSIMLCQINPLFILIIVVAFLLYFTVQKRNDGKWEKYYDELLAPEERMSAYFEGILADRVNHSTVQMNRQLPFFAGRYEEHSDLERKYRLKINILSFFTELAMSIFFFVMMTAVLLYTADGIVKGKYTLGSYTLMISLMFELFFLFKDLTWYIFAEKEYIKSIKTYYEIMNLPDIEIDKPSDSQDGILKVNHLIYRYAQSQCDTLKGLSCYFSKGEKIAIVGENGSGKTTFTQILLGLLESSSGEYKNGVGKTVAIMQDFKSYQFTVKENVELGRGGAHMEDEEVWEILKKVDIYDHIKTLPDGIYTHIGQLENGVEFSKGQFQRLALARMLANKDAKVWILDEPTAFLDPISEIKMYEYILSLAEDRLVFFISHRLGFAKKADGIIVINDGIISEMGTHAELMALEQGKYRTMYNSQLEWYGD